MSPVEKAVRRLIEETWTAARDPKLAKDHGALERWRTYGVQKVEGLIEAEAQRRLMGESE